MTTGQGLMQIIVTRAEPEAEEGVQALAALGVQALALPLIEITSAPDKDAVANAWARLHEMHAVMFVSARAVEGFCRQRPADVAEHPWAWATGPGTKRALLRAQWPAEKIIAPDAAAPQFDSEALWPLVEGDLWPGAQVLIVRGAHANNPNPQGAGRDWLAGRIEGAGGTVEFLAAYQRRCPVWSEAERQRVQDAAKGDAVWLFGSSEAVRNLRMLMPEQSWHASRALATHPRIAQVLRDAGFGWVRETRPGWADVAEAFAGMRAEHR